ncbi:MAG TPA: siphovirus Gp157 family protein [Dongiaceae bacterium]|nr:siphovirus Gp157 family protein [Dongiaceae bacterium]
MTSLSLYVIAAEHRQMVERLMDTQDDAQAIADTIEAESYPLEVKAQNVAYAVRNLEASAAAIKEAEKQMADRRKSIENRAMHVKEYLKTCMEVAGVKKIDCPHFALTIKSNPASVDVFEPGLVPAEFMRQPEPPPPAIDKKAIAEALKAGLEVPGAMLAQGTRLEIR